MNVIQFSISLTNSELSSSDAGSQTFPNLDKRNSSPNIVVLSASHFALSTRRTLPQIASSRDANTWTLIFVRHIFSSLSTPVSTLVRHFFSATFKLAAVSTVCCGCYPSASLFHFLVSTSCWVDLFQSLQRFEEVCAWRGLRTAPLSVPSLGDKLLEEVDILLILIQFS